MPNKVPVSKETLTQEEKWFLMTTLGVPWTEFPKISAKDQLFLLAKAKEAEKIRTMGAPQGGVDPRSFFNNPTSEPET